MFLFCIGSVIIVNAAVQDICMYTLDWSQYKILFLLCVSSVVSLVINHQITCKTRNKHKGCVLAGNAHTRINGVPRIFLTGICTGKGEWLEAISRSWRRREEGNREACPPPQSMGSGGASKALQRGSGQSPDRKRSGAFPA